MCVPTEVDYVTIHTISMHAACAVRKARHFCSRITLDAAVSTVLADHRFVGNPAIVGEEQS
jgi:hypothetical protein